jgi:hypothetical protein
MFLAFTGLRLLPTVSVLFAGWYKKINSETDQNLNYHLLSKHK